MQIVSESKLRAVLGGLPGTPRVVISGNFASGAAGGLSPMALRRRSSRQGPASLSGRTHADGGRPAISGPKVPGHGPLCLCWGKSRRGGMAIGQRTGREGAAKTALTHNDAGSPAGIPDWMDGFPVVLPPGTSFPIRVEDYRAEGQYVLRAELPGVDPEKDITVTASGGAIAIRAERHETAERRHHAEFRYGLFARTIRLPMDADSNHIQATYGNGILQINVTLRTALSEQPDHHVPVMANHHIKPT